MNTVIRSLLTLALTFPVVAVLSAQEPAPVTPTAATTTAATPRRSSDEIRQDFSTLLRQSPPELATILALDPTLLSNEPFLAGYPELSRFVALNPEVRRNPRFYLEQFPLPDSRGGLIEEVLEGVMIFATFLLITLALAWLVRTIVEQKRWNRLSRTQSEVHNKILDRFGTAAELLEYVRTPAGTKFLESAPIPLRAEYPTQNPSLARVMWSIQIGVIVAAGALGMLLVSGRFDKESAQGLFAMGVIGLCVGGGFVVSAAVSIFLSRRLGVWQQPLSPEAESADRLAGS